jgi:polyhydroxyalkanoate synthesis regulator protein
MVALFAEEPDSIMADARSTTNDEQKVAVVKKYANRRLYNTGSSSYVTLDDLSND